MKLILGLRLFTTTVIILLFSLPVWAETVSVSINSSGIDSKAIQQGVLSLTNKTTRPLEKATGNSQVTQYNAQFTPLITVVQAGTTVSFPNKDNFAHHVYSFSQAKSFDSELYGEDDSIEVLFDQPGVVALGCNIHDWMIAYIYVIETRFYQRVTKNTVTFRDVPNGSYELAFWQPSMATPFTEDVIINGDDSIDFRINQPLKEVIPIPAPEQNFSEEDDY